MNDPRVLTPHRARCILGFFAGLIGSLTVGMIVISWGLQWSSIGLLAWIGGGIAIAAVSYGIAFGLITLVVRATEDD